jgi:fimbrial chaperone protein
VLRRIAFAALVVAGLLAAPSARAGEMDVNPVLVELSSAEKNVVVTIRNRSKEPGRYNIALFAWDQTTSGEMKLTDTQDVVAFPRTLALGPGEARIVRVGTIVPFGAVEKAYRLFIEELPPAARPESASRVQVLSRVSIPVFVEPERTQERAAIEGLRVAGGKAEFKLRNVGNVRLRPNAVRLVAEDAAGKPLHEAQLQAWYVLAAGERHYGVQLPAEHCAKARGVTVEVALAKDVVRARAELPPGGCGP